MNPGLLDRRLTVQKRATARDKFGDSVESWSDIYKNYPARLISTTVMERATASAQSVDSSIKIFRIRYISNIDPANYRIIYLGDVYDIDGIEEARRRAYIDLQCRRNSTITNHV